MTTRGVRFKSGLIYLLFLEGSLSFDVWITSLLELPRARSRQARRATRHPPWYLEQIIAYIDKHSYACLVCQYVTIGWMRSTFFILILNPPCWKRNFWVRESWVNDCWCSFCLRLQDISNNGIDKRFLVFHHDEFQLAVPSQCWEISRKTNTVLCFLR